MVNILWARVKKVRVKTAERKDQRMRVRELGKQARERAQKRKRTVRWPRSRKPDLQVAPRASARALA